MLPNAPTPAQMQRQRYVAMVRAIRAYLMQRQENGQYLICITIHNNKTGEEDDFQPIECDVNNPTATGAVT